MFLPSVHYNNQSREQKKPVIFLRMMLKLYSIPMAHVIILSSPSPIFHRHIISLTVLSPLVPSCFLLKLLFEIVSFQCHFTFWFFISVRLLFVTPYKVYIQYSASKSPLPMWLYVYFFTCDASNKFDAGFMSNTSFLPVCLLFVLIACLRLNRGKRFQSNLVCRHYFTMILFHSLSLSLSVQLFKIQ